METTLDINSVFSVGLSNGRKRLIAEIISLHVSLDNLLDALVKAGKIKGTEESKFYTKACALKKSKLKTMVIDFNEIRNICAHERIDKKEKVALVINRCRGIIERVNSTYPEKYTIAERNCSSPLKVAIIVIFDEISNFYNCSTERVVELDGFYAPGQKTLDDEITEVIG